MQRGFVSVLVHGVNLKGFPIVQNVDGILRLRDAFVPQLVEFTDEPFRIVRCGFRSINPGNGDNTVSDQVVCVGAVGRVLGVDPN